ncbi:MAG: LytR C-terminal domain-containing protein, partial [Solirubrobacterales bacterium]
MKTVIETVGPYAGLVSMIGLFVVIGLLFSQGRDLRRLREWAGGAPERDAEIREVSEIVAEERSQELKVMAEREERLLSRSGHAGGGFWDRLGRTGRIMAIAAAVLIIGAGAAYAGTTLLGGDDTPTRSVKANQATGMKPSKIKANVLNGTGGAEVGLAAQYASALEGRGFKVGLTDDAPSTFEESIAMFTQGNEEAAKQVARALDIAETGLITSEVAAV